MKNCERCRFLSTGYHGEGLCEFFGDDAPDWVVNNTDGCLLKYQEVDKAIKLSQDVRYFDFEKREADGTPIRYEKTCKKYDDYIKELMKRCNMRRKNN